ncbi:helix-turn-helix domain-containing protein [Tautonia plasticadhaerens]|uniref:Transcriptional repressor DicA n=1 Tax=Tautonia plasticadhaerens TaxID=2527974 RepID=A0A518GWH7_9BACT|nr:helix-turn-helix domain-containing protein [Tautonia plasticadhaerens]QDV32911.1 transcriptional repressor DicA [Tautonia plasticadhaerens]
MPHINTETIRTPAEPGDDTIRALVPTAGRPSPRLRARTFDRAPGPGRDGRPLRLDEKIYRRMLQLGMSQQALAQKSGVSDSEISRLLNGQSKRPGLHNILRLARALEVSLDFLADDQLGSDPRSAVDSLSGDDRELLDRARSIGHREVAMLLDATRVLGFEVAIRRLYGIDHRPEPDDPSKDPARA